VKILSRNKFFTKKNISNQNVPFSKLYDSVGTKVFPFYEKYKINFYLKKYLN